MKREVEEEEDDGGPGTLTLAPPSPPGIPHPQPPPQRTTGMPIHEDCWSEEASCTLVSAWGERYLELNRGNLRQKHWQSVADTVNNRHAANSNNFNNKNFKSRRTDVQCKNRIDTLKKKYKLEKARVLSSNGSYKSNWALYDQLDALIGSSVQTKKMMAVSSSSSPQRTTTPQLALPYYQQQRKVQPNSSVGVPLTLRGGGGDRQKRSAASSGAGGYGQGIHTEIDESFFRRNYSAVAAAAAAAADDLGGNSDSSSAEIDRGEGDGFGELAKAISKFADIFERVEGARQRQMLELEKERMEFMKSLEYQRMQLFMDSQIQIEKIKRAKHDAPAASD